MPDVFEKFFSLFEKYPSKLFKLKRLDPAYRMFFQGSERVDIVSNLDKNIALFQRLEKDGGIKLRKYLKQSQYQYEVAMKKFIYKSYSSWLDLLDKQLFLEGSKLKVFEGIDRFVRRYFSSDFARKILEYNIVFLGGNPQNTPALYSIMAHIDFNLGVWYPMGGIGEVVNELIKLCDEHGVKIVSNSEVVGFTYKNGLIYEAITKKRKYQADIVISNTDYAHMEINMLESTYQSYSSKYWTSRTVAPSAYMMYLGVKGKVKNLAHHNLFVEDDWMKHFDDIFKNPKWPKHFSYYVSCPSKTDSSVSPIDDENIFVLLPIAPGLRDTKKIRERYFGIIMDRLENSLGEKIRDRIITKKIACISDFKNRYHAYKGTALGLTHTLFQTAIFRPSMKSKKLRNLYYTGQYTHPGIGMPMVLIAAELVAQEVMKTYGN
jgi:phytoene desaturase